MNKQTKRWLVAAALLVVIGCGIFGGVMTVLKWDFAKLSTVNYETNTYELNEAFTHISVVTRTADVVFVPAENETVSVVCYEQQNAKHTVTVQDGTLTVKLSDTRKWYEYIGIGFGAPKLTVAIPQREYGTLSVSASTGKISVQDLAVEVLDLAVSTGEIAVSDVTCKGDVKMRVSTGKTNVTDVTCNNVISSGSTGDVLLKNVIAAEAFSVKRSTGDVKFERCDAAEIDVKTDTGNVKGSLLSDKVFIAETDTGRVDVPKTTSGGRCMITTDTGNITIRIEK